VKSRVAIGTLLSRQCNCSTPLSDCPQDPEICDFNVRRAQELGVQRPSNPRSATLEGHSFVVGNVATSARTPVIRGSVLPHSRDIELVQVWKHFIASYASGGTVVRDRPVLVSLIDPDGEGARHGIACGPRGGAIIAD
jgi:hypothetical protein